MAPSGWLEQVAARVGVTRVARITDLDRAGVEVACALRPGGHVLQVSNGKGATLAEARVGAVLEAAELWAAERVPPGELVWGSLQELPGAWGAEELGSAGALVAPRLWSERTRLAWRRATDLFNGEEVLVPAQAVHCPSAGAAPLGPSLVRWTSNGMGAHPDADAALLHALLEAVERDAVARALPEGFTEDAVRDRLLAEASLPAAVRALFGGLRARGFWPFAFDLLGPSGVPTFAVLLIDGDGAPVPLTAGYASGLTAEAALLGAAREAAQSRLTDVHGAREDVALGSGQGHGRAGGEDAAEAARSLRELCSQAPGRRLPGGRSAEGRSAGGRRGSRALLSTLRRAGLQRAAAVDLSPPDLGVHVVKVILPGLLVSELL